MTPEIHLHVLASGSKGNAALIEGPGGIVLVDDGISRKALLTRADELGVDAGRIAGVILTHEHSDHVGGLSVFCNRFDGPLFATAGTAGARRYLTELPFTLIGHDDEFELAGMCVRTFPTSHDVADPVGLRFSTSDDALGFCTDTGKLGEKAADKLYATLKEMDLLDDVVFGTFNQNVTDYVDKNYPDMLRSSSICEVLDFWFAYLTNADLNKRGVGYCALQIPYSKTLSFLGTKGLVEYAHKYNIAVQYWTINEEDDVSHLQSIGADCIMSDAPDMCYNVLKG